MVYSLALFILLSINAFAEEPCDQFDPFGGQEISVIEEAVKDCSEIAKSSQSHFRNIQSDRICSCLDSAKFNEIRVSNNRKKAFTQWEYDKTIRGKLNYSLNDLIGNFTKLNNLVLTKDHLGNLIDVNDPICNIQTLETEVKNLQQKQGSTECPSPKGFMDNRISEIFGTKNPSEITDVLEKKIGNVNESSCLSSQMYLNLRSSNGSSSLGFQMLSQMGSFSADRRSSAATREKDFVQLFLEEQNPYKAKGLKDLVSYDVIFNLAFRDNLFRDQLNKRIKSFTDSGGRLYDIYNDQETLKLAYKSINRSCIELTSNIKNFLCAKEYPKLDPATQSLHLDDYFQKEKDPLEARSMRDYFTWDFSCNEDRRSNTYRRGIRQVLTGQRANQVPLTPEEKVFNDYVGQTVMVKAATKDVFENSPDSDYNRFNKMFCNGRQGSQISENDFPVMMKEYFNKMKTSGIDINAILSDPELAQRLGLKIDITAEPIFQLTKQSDIAAGKLPKINQIKWNEEVLPLLKAKGIPEAEINQLYAMIEMQTNRKFTEIEDLKKKLAKDNPAFENMSLGDIHGVVRRDPRVIARLTQTNTIPDFNPVASIQQRHEALRVDVAQTSNAAQDVLFNNKDVQTIRAEAQEYNANQGTYSSNMRTPASSQSKVGEPSTNPDQPRAISPTTQAPRSFDNSSRGQQIEERSISSTSNTIVPPIVNSSALQSTAPSISQPNNSHRSQSRNNETSRNNLNSDTNPNQNIPERSRSIDDEIAKIQDEIRKGQQDYAEAENKFRSLTRRADNLRRARNYENLSPNGNMAQRSQYSGPSNLPVKNSQTGEYSYPNGGQELSSSSKGSENNKLEKDSLNGAEGQGGTSVGASTGNDSTEGTKGQAVGGSAASGIAGITKNLPKGERAPGSEETEEETRKRLNLQPYEHHKIIPYAIFDIVGSVDKVVVILGLEGMKFKTIEAIENPSENSEIKYFIRTFDFVPDGEFEEFKEEFVTPEIRASTYSQYFGFSRNKNNLKRSKKFSKATKEIAKEEVAESYVLRIQNQIMDEEEIRNTMNKVLEKIQ